MSEAAQERLVELPEPFSLELTTWAWGFGSRDWTSHAAEGCMWRATRTPAGPATGRFERVPAGVIVRAWGPGASYLLERAPDLLGLSDHPEDFEPTTRLIRDLAHRFAGLRFGRGLPPSEVVMPWICGQRVTHAEAKDGWSRLVEGLGEPAPGPGPDGRSLRVPPLPRTIARGGPQALGRFGIDLARARVLVEAARLAPRLDEATTMAPAEALARLQAVRGIGPWTAAKVAGAALGDPDAVAVGDFHLPNVVSWALAREPRADDARMLELLEPWRGHRGRVTRLLSLSGIWPPRYGPRLAPRRY